MQALALQLPALHQKRFRRRREAERRRKLSGVRKQDLVDRIRVRVSQRRRSRRLVFDVLFVGLVRRRELGAVVSGVVDVSAFVTRILLEKIEGHVLEDDAVDRHGALGEGGQLARAVVPEKWFKPQVRSEKYQTTARSFRIEVISCRNSIT